MDKFGHAFTSYQLGIYGYNSFKWAGYDEMTSILYGGLSGSIFLSAVEILDGFSSQWELPAEIFSLIQLDLFYLLDNS